MADSWYLKTNGDPSQPVSGKQLLMLATDGIVQPETLVSRDGAQWFPARELNGLWQAVDAQQWDGESAQRPDKSPAPVPRRRSGWAAPIAFLVVGCGVAVTVAVIQSLEVEPYQQRLDESTQARRTAAETAPAPKLSPYITRKSDGQLVLKPGLVQIGDKPPALAFGYEWTNETQFDAAPKKGYVWRDKSQSQLVPYAYERYQMVDDDVLKLETMVRMWDEQGQFEANWIRGLLDTLPRWKEFIEEPRTPDPFVIYWKAECHRARALGEEGLAWKHYGGSYRPVRTSESNGLIERSVHAYKTAIEARERVMGVAYSQSQVRVLAFLHFRLGICQYLARNDSDSKVSFAEAQRLDPQLQSLFVLFREWKRIHDEDEKHLWSRLEYKWLNGPLMEALARHSKTIAAINLPPSGWPMDAKR